MKRFILLALVLFCMFTLSSCSLEKNEISSFDYPEQTDIVGDFPQTFTEYLVSNIEIDNINIDAIKLEQATLDPSNYNVTKVSKLSSSYEITSMDRQYYIYEISFEIYNQKSNYLITNLVYNLDSHKYSKNVHKEAVIRPSSSQISRKSESMSCDELNCTISLDFEVLENITLQNVQFSILSDSIVKEALFNNYEVQIDNSPLNSNMSLTKGNLYHMNILVYNTQPFNSSITFSYNLDGTNYQFFTDDYSTKTPNILLHELNNNIYILDEFDD